MKNYFEHIPAVQIRALYIYKIIIIIRVFELNQNNTITILFAIFAKYS